MESARLSKDLYCNFLLFLVKCKIVIKIASLIDNSKSICSKDLFLLISDLWVTQWEKKEGYRENSATAKPLSFPAIRSNMDSKVWLCCKATSELVWGSQSSSMPSASPLPKGI